MPIDFIAEMPGPRFLAFYLVVLLITLAVTWWRLREADTTGSLSPLPILHPPDPYRIACLRGGRNEVARLVILSLVERGFLRIEGDRIVQQKRQADPASLTPMERTCYGFFAEPRSAKDVFSARSPASLVAGLCDQHEREFQAQQLMPTEEWKSAKLWIAFQAAAVITILGAYKLAVALAKGRTNVGFLIALWVIGMIVVLVMARTPRLSRRGRQHLADWRVAFDHFKSGAPQAQAGAVNPALLLAVGVFGVGVLAGGPLDPYRRMFASSSSEGSVVASCGSSGSSSDGGGSGCGGGGCGGCGGS